MASAFLSANLQYYRRLRGLTQSQLARLAGGDFSQTYVSRLERGLAPSDARHVGTLAEALNVTADALLRRPRFVRCLSALRAVVLLEAEA